MHQELPLFFELISKSALLNKAVTDCCVSDDDLEGFDHYRPTTSRIILKNFEVARNVWFSEVDILMTRFGVLIDFISLDVKYFENAKIYFNTTSTPRRKPFKHYSDPHHGAKHIKISSFDLFSKSVNGCVIRSDVFGCKIMTCFH
jgi:hypothetical protein